MRAAHIILGYKPISSSFQSSKNVIKAKDPWLHQINVAIPRFLTSPPSEGTLQVELPTQCIAEEETTLAQDEETVKVIEVVDSEEDFEVFDRPYPTESPGTTSGSLPTLKSAAAKS